MDETTGLRERKKAQTRSAISNAVLLLALDRGLDAVTADDIAAAADVSVRTFHNYFGSKEEALISAWRSQFEVHLDELRAEAGGRADPRVARARVRRHRGADRRPSRGRGLPVRSARQHRLPPKCL